MLFGSAAMKLSVPHPEEPGHGAAGEVGELVAEFQWLTPERAATVMTEDAEAAARIRAELGDVTNYLVQLADVLGWIWSKLLTPRSMPTTSGIRLTPTEAQHARRLAVGSRHLVETPTSLGGADQPDAGSNLPRQDRLVLPVAPALSDRYGHPPLSGAIARYGMLHELVVSP